MTETTNGKRDSESLKSSLAKKIVVPIAATAASAAATYAAKRAPRLLEEKVWPFVEQKVLPLLRDGRSGAGDVARDLPSAAKRVAGGAGDVAHDLTERARSLPGIPDGSSGASRGDGRRSRPAKELEQRRAQRARARAERRKAVAS